MQKRFAEKQNRLEDIDKIVYTAEDLMQIFDMGRDCTYRLMKSDGFPVITLNKRLYLEADMLKKWLKARTGKIYNF